MPSLRADATTAVMHIPLERLLQVCAYAGSALVVSMVAIFFTTGVGQDPLQFVHPVKEYSAILLKTPPALRAAIGLDNLFIVMYTTAFAAQGALLLKRGAAPMLVRLALGLLLLLAALDLIENMHFLQM